MMGWWSRVVFPIRRVLIGVASRFGILKSRGRRRRGLGRLRYEVSACEYDDVHVMWEMLRRRREEETWMAAPIEPRRRQRDATLIKALCWPRRWAVCHMC